MPLQITSRVEHDDDDYFSFELTFSDEMSVNTVISEPYLNTPEEWDAFIESVDTGSDNWMNFYCGNGEGYTCVYRRQRNRKALVVT